VGYVLRVARVAVAELTRRFSDARFRRTAALFWGKQWAQEHFQRQLKDSRKVEDIILVFVTTATKALKDDTQLAEGAWKYELNSQISLFLTLLSDALIASGGAGGELMSRLEGYRTRLQDDAPPPPPPPAKVAAGEKADGERDRDSLKSVVSSVGTAAGIKGKGTDHVWRLFGMPEEQLAGKLKELASSCSESAALEDLKVSFAVTNADARRCSKCSTRKIPFPTPRATLPSPRSGRRTARRRYRRSPA
jgi:hypothetical protein